MKINYHKTSISLFVIGLILLLSGCNIDQPLTGPDTGNNPDPQRNIYAYIESLGFSTQNAVEENGMIVVEGDIGFNIDDLKSEMLESGFGTKQYAHGYMVRQSKIYSISVGTAAGVPASWSAAIDTAITDWNGIANCNINFTRTTSASPDITISHDATTATYVARASFPDTAGDPGPTININPVYDYYTSAKMRWVMVHEIGHCIGMRHINNTESDRIYIPGTPETDPLSVMHPYVQSWTGFTAGDLNAAQYLYPGSGRYVVVYENASYTGKRWIIHEGDNETNASRFLLNDMISSIQCYRGARVNLYQNAGYGGSVATINNSISNLGSLAFNDITSSILWLDPYPQNIYFDFDDAYLVYAPGSDILQIAAEGNVLHYGLDWERVQIYPYLYHMRHKNWSGYYWKVNTSRKEIYRVVGPNFGSIGDTSEGLVPDVTVTVVGGEDGTAPARFFLRFSNSSLLYIPASQLVRIYASNYLISYGDDWDKCNITDSLFHIKQDVWSSFYWKINATAPYLYRIVDGVFCNNAVAGTAQALNPGIRVIW